MICGSAEDLELDHLDPGKKVSHRIWSWSATRREAELLKCRVLCGSHHKEKSALEHAKGIANGTAKLTEEQVREIRSSGMGHRPAARVYDVNEKTIRLIRKGKIWGSVV